MRGILFLFYFIRILSTAAYKNAETLFIVVCGFNFWQTWKDNLEGNTSALILLPLQEWSEVSWLKVTMKRYYYISM